MSTESGKVAAPYDAAPMRMPPAALASTRATSIRALLDAINQATSSCYATRAGFPFRTWEDVPILSGADLATEIGDHPPFGRLRLRSEPLLRAALATASLPHPVPMCWSTADLEAEAQLGARVLWRAGLRARGRTSDCLEGGLVTPGTLAITDALDAIDALALPVGPLTSDAVLARAREVWSIVQPQMLITALDTFSFLSQRSDVPALTYVLLLTPSEAAALSSATRAHVFRVLSVPIVGTFIAGECSGHEGLHLAEDAYLAEVVDGSGKPLPDGQSGRLILSTLQRSHAVLRLDTGLRASIDRTPCDCGDTHARLRMGVG